MKPLCNLSRYFWKGKTGMAMKSQDTGAHLIALYATIHINATPLGIFHLSINEIQQDLNMGEIQIKHHLTSLIAIEFCEYDFENEFIWILEMAHFHHYDTCQKFLTLPSEKRKSLLNTFVRLSYRLPHHPTT